MLWYQIFSLIRTVFPYKWNRLLVVKVLLKYAYTAY